jgi:hypothetical protein
MTEAQKKRRQTAEYKEHRKTYIKVWRAKPENKEKWAVYMREWRKKTKKD